MEPDKFQQAWQAHSSETRVTVDADLLRKEVQRDQLKFRTANLWSDIGLIGITIALLAVWLFLGVMVSLPWTWYLAVPTMVWGVAFLLVYRMRHRQNSGHPDEPLIRCVERSCTELENQVWLQQNAFWWSSLPLLISLLAFLAHATWMRSRDWLDALGHAGVFVFLFAVFGFVYLANRYVVRRKYEPRRRDLLTLLASLREETIGEGTGEHVALPTLPFAEERDRSPFSSPERVALTMIGVMFIVLVLGALVVVTITEPHLLTGDRYPKRSPFAAVKWQEFQPEVELSGEWFKLVSLDGVPAEEIVEFSRQTYGDKWRKRFEEDLVELLTEMGHRPEKKVTLVVQSLTSTETWTWENVPMTYANRQAIRAAAEAREDAKP